ncbi:unnamed protein product [Gadus morhua 'NCC']
MHAVEDTLLDTLSNRDHMVYPATAKEPSSPHPQAVTVSGRLPGLRGLLEVMWTKGRRRVMEEGKKGMEEVVVVLVEEGGGEGRDGSDGGGVVRGWKEGGGGGDGVGTEGVIEEEGGKEVVVVVSNYNIHDGVRDENRL